MSNVSTFGAFTMAKLGIYASQKAMQVTGNNITNINTPGYTRQSLDLKSLYVGGADRYASKWDAKIGSGVLVTGVSQIRSPYLDIRYRTENSRVGKEEKTLEGLNGLSQIFDEVGMGEDSEGVMEAAFQDMIEQLTHYNTSGSGEDTFDTVFKGSVSQVLNIFNVYAGKLEDLYDNTVDSLRNDVTKVNGILSDIRSLNNQIRKAEIHGSNALELKDERNLRIDELSKYIRINVIYEEEDLGAGCIVDKLTIRLDSGDESSAGHDGTLLVDGKYATQLMVPDVNVPEEHPAPECTGMFDVTLDALRDVRGKPKMIVEGDPAVLASEIMTQPDTTGSLTIGGYTANGITKPANMTDAEAVEDQLRQFCKAYNTDPANTQWRAAISLEKNSVIFTAADSQAVPAVPASETTLPTTPSTNGKLTLGGFTADVTLLPTPDGGTPPTDAEQVAHQLSEYIAAYNEANAPVQATLNGTQIDYAVQPLTKSGDLTINGYSVFIRGAESMTLTQQLEAFRDVYNKDPDNEPDYMTLSADGTQLIYTTEKNGPIDPATIPADMRLVSNGVEPVPDPQNMEVALTDTDLYGALQATREMLTEEGEFASRDDLIRDPNATNKRGIPYYTKIWDAMARKFADTLNDANTLEDKNGDLKKDEFGNYIVKPQNYYVTDEDGNYLDADGNIIPANPVNGSDYTAYKEFLMNGADYVDEDGNVITPDPNDGYTIYLKDAAGNYLDKNGNVIPLDANNGYTGILTDQDGNPVDENGNRIYMNPDGTYWAYKTNAKGEYLDEDDNVIEANDDGTYWTYQKDKDGKYVDKDGTPLDPNPDGSYCEYLKNEDGKYVDKLGNEITPNPEDNTYNIYKTVEKDDGTEWYVDEDGNELGEVGKGLPAGAVITGDLRVPGADKRVQVDMRVPTTTDRRVVDLRVVTGDKRVITGDKRVVREQYRGGILFSNSGDNNDPTNITAKNISISHDWRNNAIHVMQSRDDTSLDTSTANSNIRHMVSIVKDNNFSYMLSDMDDDFLPGNDGGNEDVEYFKGNFADMLTKIGSQLGMDTSETQDRLSNYTTSLVELEVDRESVSGVDLNDEAIAMMQYNKSYSAACRFMTTLDEMLDKLINGTAI